MSAGQASISENNTTVRIDQQSDRAVIDWRGFDIAPNERTEFHQPSSSSIALNRVNSGTASHIDGQLSANGNLVIVNQNGVVFGRGAQVDVNSIVASTADTSNEQFMAGGKLVLDKPGNPDASIINEGTITAKDAGLVGFVAPRVENHGVITARLGRAQLASGDTATVDFYGDGLLEVAVSDSVSKQLVTNTGRISADGGLVAMTAAAGKNIVDSVINARGTIQAKTVGIDSGRVLIAGNKATDVIIDGLIEASGLGLQQTGGAVHILGNRIALMNNSKVDVSGTLGAGEILVGGDYHGGAYRGMLEVPQTAVEWGNTPGGYSAVNRSPTAAFFAAYYAGLSRDGGVPTASRVFVDKNVILDASSSSANAGRVVIWSNNGTAFYGHAEVTANGIVGNGGFVEVSGKDWLGFAGSVKTLAANGHNGALLLDPADITISLAADSAITGASPFDSTGGATSNLSVATLQAALAGGAVIITSAAGTGGSGDITFVDAVAWNSANGLTVTASGNIIVNNTITNSGGGGITLNANIAGNGSITVNNNISTGGSITTLSNGDTTIAAGATLTTGSLGSLNLQAAGGSIAGTGNLTINGNLAMGTGTLTLLSGINGTRPSLTLNGTNFTLLGANIGTTSITGFQDVTLTRNLPVSGNITINPQQDFILSTAQSYSNASTFSVTASRNISINNTFNNSGAGAVVLNANVAAAGSITISNSMTTGGNFTALANRDLTVAVGAVITPGAGSALSLQAANGVIGGTGNLTLNGRLNLGSGLLTLVSGVNGTRPSWTMNASTITLQGASMGGGSITGFQDVTLAMNLIGGGNITINPQQDFIMTAAQSSGNVGFLSVTAGRNITISNTFTNTSTGSFTLNANVAGTGSITLNNNITLNGGTLTTLSMGDTTLAGGAAITANGTSAISMRAANGVVTGTGNLTLNGTIAAGTGALTLLSGINGTRPSLTLSGANFTLTGATVGTTSITGFQDVTLSRNLTSSGSITISPQRDFILSASQTLAISSGASTISITALRDIITNAGSVISTGTTGSLSLLAANNVVTGTGNLTLGGNISVGTGTLTLLSGINGTRPSWTMNGTSFTQLGATVATVNIQGFLDQTVSTNITGSGSVTIIAQRDLTLSAGQTITTGAAGVLSLQAANSLIAGTGNLTISGNLAVGTGTLTLLSGINGTRPSLTLNGTNFTMLGATVGVTTITGFQDVTLSRNLTSSGAITINPQRDFILSASQTLAISSGANTISITALRDITTGASSVISTGTTGSLTLRAANNVVAGTGNLTLGGNLSVGTGTLTLNSGINGTRPSWVMDSSSFTMLGATVGATSITGFQDVTVSRNFTSSGAITITPQRDFILSASQTLAISSGASTISITALRDIITNASSVISTGTTGSLSLLAANNVVAGTGNLTLGGNLSVGTGTLTLNSGINGTRPSWTMNSTSFTMLGASVGTTSINGFQDVTISSNFTGSGAITINPQRDFILSASQNLTAGGAGALTILALRDLIANTGSVIRSGASGATSLRAANGAVGGTGNLTLNGNLSQGTGNLTLLSGQNGLRPSWTMNSTSYTQLSATVGVINIQGFLDLTVATNVTSSGSITLSADRDLTVNASQTITTGAAGALSVQAARGNTAATGNLVLNGNLSAGTGALTLTSGANGTRPSWTMNNTNFTTLGATVGAVAISGFQDFTLDRNLTSSSTMAITANRDLNINAGTTLTGGAAAAFSLLAANNVVGGTGRLNINGNLSVGTGNFTLLSGTNAGRPNLTLNSTNLAMAATVGNVNTQGFNTLTLARAINSTGTITNSNNTLTVLGANITSTGAQTYSNATTIAEAASVTLATTNANVQFSTTLNGTAGGVAENLTVTAGTGQMTFTGIVGGTTPLGDLSVTADNLTVSANLNGTGVLTLRPTTAARAINYASAQADNNTANGFNLSNAEVTRIGAGWSSVVVGNTTSGLFTNTRATLGNNTTFISGDDFVNSTALTSGFTILVQAVRDVILNQSMATTNTSANALTLVAGRNFVNNVGAGALTTGAGGRWLVYSTNPTANTGIASLSNAFNRYSCTYGGSCPTLGTGNGFLYSFTPLLDVTIASQTYNYGDAVIAPTGYTLQTSGYLNALDSAQGTVGGTGNFTTSYVQGNNAGTSFTITNNGSTFSSNLGYGFNYISPTGLTVGTRSITLQVSNQSITYGNNLNANAYTVSSGSFYGTDAASLVLTTNATSSSAGFYNYSATPWTLSASGANFSSGLAANYSISYVAAPTGLTVAQRALAISATGTNRVYDGTTSDTVTLSDNRVAGDVMTTSYTAANFANKNVGTGKSVSVTGIGLTGTDSGNYTFNTTASTSADITARALTISATGTNRVYDGTTADTVTLSDNRVAGDTLTTSYTAANFANKNVGTGKSVSVTGIGLAGTDSGNYTFNTTASTSADITARALTISATGTNRVYDGTTADTVTLSDNRVAGDTLTTSYTAANFANKNVGTGKSVSVTGIGLTGTDSGNYTFNTTASTSADITARALTISATGTNRVYDGTTADTVTLSDNRVAGDVMTTSYTAANFANKNVGTGKSVSVTGIGLAGTDSGNYTFNTTASTSADITLRALNISATGANKVYDGLVGATVTLSDDRVTGDTLSTNFAAADFVNANIGTAKQINVTGITLGGSDSSNYTFNTTATAFADILLNAPTPVTLPIQIVQNTQPALIAAVSTRNSSSIARPLALQIPNTVKKATQNPFPEISVDHIPEFLLYDDEWQKHQYRLPARGMLR